MRALLAEAGRFGAVGLVNTAAGLGLIWLAMALGAAPLAANALGYAVGLAISFTLNRRWTFGRDGPAGRGEMLRFAATFALAWSLNAGVLWLGLRLTEVSPYLLQIACVPVYSSVFFLLCRIWVFARPR